MTGVHDRDRETPVTQSSHFSLETMTFGQDRRYRDRENCGKMPVTQLSQNSNFQT